MHEQDKIIVLRNYDTSLEANLAKTKLDAYGIPCFLTGENLSNLYPINNARFSGVRLHLFSKDEEQARQVLNEIVLLEEHEVTRCPRCRSTRVEFTYTKKPGARLFSTFKTLLMALFPPKKVFHCNDCECEF